MKAFRHDPLTAIRILLADKAVGMTGPLDGPPVPDGRKQLPCFWNRRP